jgi:hypothetical protein
MAENLSKFFLERVLNQGIRIFGGHPHIWLSHSNSSMKKKSFWYISEEGGVLIRKEIIEKLGKINEKESQSKQVARQAQNMTSTIPIVSLQAD